MHLASSHATSAPIHGDWRATLRSDYTLAVLALGGLVAALWLAPFAVWRALTGNWVAAVSDTVLALAIGGAAVYAWRTGDTRWPGRIMAIAIVGGIWAIGAAAQFAALFWAYPGVLMMFFLVPASVAAVLGVLAVAGAAILSWPELGGTQGLPFFIITNVLTGVFGYLVSQQAHTRITRWQTLSLIDPLTGVGNRRLLEAECSQAFTGQRSAGTLAVVDLDHFKSINDRFGHDRGDAVLRDTASVVQSALRKTDRLYRFGGEEFVVWLAETDATAALSVLERIRQRVREQVRLDGEPVTFSAGVAVHAPPESWQDVLARADAALYRAKREGRDRILLAGAGDAQPGQS
ncbi:diguanylate cyclase [uncultured Tepidimonas sp.]|uniref:GGDEF domain-containing protein n=1 Tax=uncultured Tepidimonas sp. TaxID=453579 RepID=UPI00260F4360|nr:diguanylate cyclase [uncultured Tepidimonas sp.]